MSLTKEEIRAIKSAYEKREVWIGSADWFGGEHLYP